MKPYRPGPVGTGILAALAAAGDGLTVSALTAATGRPPEQRTTIDQAIRVLGRQGCVRVLTRRRHVGKPAAVWVITTAGRAAYAQAAGAVTP